MLWWVTVKAQRRDCQVLDSYILLYFIVQVVILDLSCVSVPTGSVSFCLMYNYRMSKTIHFINVLCIYKGKHAWHIFLSVTGKRFEWNGSNNTTWSWKGTYRHAVSHGAQAPLQHSWRCHNIIFKSEETNSLSNF